MKTKQLTRIAFMAAILVCVFQLFAQVLYLECITFTIVVFACAFPRMEAVLSCIVFALLNMIFMGVTPWTLMYVLIYPTYALCIGGASKWLLQHRLVLYSICGLCSFLTGQLLDLPYLMFSGKITLIYILMGLKTSIIQGILSFLVCMLLFDPLCEALMKILKTRKRKSL